MAAFKKRGSSLPKAAFYRHDFKFSLKLCFIDAASNLVWSRVFKMRL